MRSSRRAHLDPDALLVVDDAAPAKVEFVVLDAHEAAGLEERERVRGVVEHVAEVLVEDVELLPKLVVVRDALLVRNLDRHPDLVERAELWNRVCSAIAQTSSAERRTILEVRDAGGVLEQIGRASCRERVS